MDSKLNKEEYNNEPVIYCKQCLSLNIKSIDDSIDYCDDCCCTDTASTNIFEWKLLKDTNN